MPKISVIIPCYNVEKYLEKCVESVIKQTYKDLEIILVDDGSPDSSPQICDDLAKTDTRIKVIHKKNGGISSARNVALDIATGEYVYFIDSDDYIEPETLDVMLKSMQENKVDVVIAGVQPFYNGDTKPRYFDDKIDYFNTYDKKLIMNAKEVLKMPAVAWGKLYKKSIIDKYNLRFDEGLINEDEGFNWYYNTKVKSGIFIPNKFYNYLIRDNSIMGKKQNDGEKIADILYIFDNIYNHLIKYNLYKKYSRIFRDTVNCTIDYTRKLAQEFNDKKLINECDERYVKYNKYTFMERLIYDGDYKFIERIFSIKNTRDGEYKVICILGIKIKFKRKKKEIEQSDKIDDKTDNKSIFLQLLQFRKFLLQSKIKKQNKSQYDESIWHLWLQGYDNAPDIVKISVNSIKKYAGNRKLVLLDEKNLDKFIKIPDHIQRKYHEGKIKPAHYSDYIRTALLAKYGGIWIDSTVVLTSKIPSDIIRSSYFMFKNNMWFVFGNNIPSYDYLYSIKQPIFKDNALHACSNWFIRAKKDSFIVHNMLSLLDKYWEQYDEAIDYFFYHGFITVCITGSEDCKQEWLDMPVKSNMFPHVLQNNLLNKEENINTEEFFKYSFCHKLNREIESSLLYKVFKDMAQ